jgi:DNA-binding CsgD family transcriptional regulator
MNSRQHVYALWDELAAYPAADIDKACNHLLTTICNWLNADNAAWIGAIRLLHGPSAMRDGMLGWRVKVITYVNPPTEVEALAARQIIAKHAQEPGLTTVAALQGSGTFRVHRLCDGFVDLDNLRGTAHYRAYYEAFGVEDRLWVGSPISDEAESCFVFDKRHTLSRFSEADAELAGYAVRGLTWFQRQLFYSHGLLVAQEPLTAMERQVVQLLLTDKSEKEIAVELGQSPHTTHGHVKEIYRKYNVTGRAGLMAVWLSYY